MASSYHPAMPRRMSVRAFAAAYILVAGLAAVGAWFDVETIVAGFPVLIAIGSVVIYLALGRDSLPLLCWGLSSYWVVAAMCLMIAIGDMGPDEAQPFLPPVMSVYAFSLTAWPAGIERILDQRASSVLARVFPVRFNLRAMLVVVTLVCIAAAIASAIQWQGSNGEMAVFGTGALALLGISGAILWWFVQLRKRDASSNSSE